MAMLATLEISQDKVCTYKMQSWSFITYTFLYLSIPLQADNNENLDENAKMKLTRIFNDHNHGLMWIVYMNKQLSFD